MSSLISKTLLVMLLSLVTLSAFSQDELPVDTIQRKSKARKESKNEAPLKDRLFTGGDLGAQFGSITAINISPVLGYWITPEKFSAGVGGVYQYYNNRFYRFSTSIYGGNVFTRYYLSENIFLHGEYELLNVDALDGFHKRVWVPGTLAGGGYRQQLGERSSFNFMILYNFTESNYTPYRNPVIRAGINIGL